MTIDEALNILEPKLLFPPEFNEAISVVKDEMNQYRAIGTIKGYKRTIEVSKENYSLYLEYKAKVKTYETIGTPKECRAAVEKQKAKKPYFEGDGYADGHLVYDTWICPCCGKDYEVDYDDYDFCPNCGQKLDWSD